MYSFDSSIKFAKYYQHAIVYLADSHYYEQDKFYKLLIVRYNKDTTKYHNVFIKCESYCKN